MNSDNADSGVQSLLWSLSKAATIKIQYFELNKIGMNAYMNWTVVGNANSVALLHLEGGRWLELQDNMMTPRLFLIHALGIGERFLKLT